MIQKEISRLEPAVLRANLLLRNMSDFESIPMESMFTLTVSYIRKILPSLTLTTKSFKVSLLGPGELYGLGRGDNSGLPFFRSCFRGLHIEYSSDLVRNILADTTGHAFDRWLHSSMLNCFDVYTRG
jgi:hypothetical protein